VEQIGRWWNGIWGRMARREVLLFRQVRWQVLARHGDADTGSDRTWFFDDEDSARRMVRRLLDTEGPGRWRRID
jgi:hypothetical protein